MHTIEIKNLEPGMITAERVLSKHGQIIVEKHKVLTTQMILHMEFYSVTQVKILDGKLPIQTIHEMAAEKEAVESHSQKVRKSKQFIDFKKSYEKKVAFLEHSLNDFITKNISFDKSQLLSQSLELFIKNSTTLSMFDMLHNMRKINDSTYAHSMNVAIISRMVGMWMNFEKDDLDTLTLSGLLHDIGKCRIPSSIIDKPARLTTEEYSVIKKHPHLGYELLRKQDVNMRVKQVALSHHERCDGSGYPYGLRGEDIDDFAIIVAIADVYDAMTADRVYRSGVCPFEVIATFEHEGLGKYKPQYIMTFLEHIANTYINNNVLLSNGLTGKIVLINKQHLTRPVIQTTVHKFINLEKHPDIYVQAII